MSSFRSTPARAAPTIAAFAVVAIACGFTAYLTLFSQFARYDDEGTLLVMLKAFVGGHVLYEDICTPYGPFYYGLFGTLARLTGLEITNNASRLVSLGLWVGSSLAVGAAVAKMTRARWLGVTAMVVGFGSMPALANEPMHPALLCAVLLSLLVLASVPSGTQLNRGQGALSGVLIACLVLVKVNVGVFAGSAFALAAVLSTRAHEPRRWLAGPVVVAFLALPVTVVARDLEVAWVRIFAAVILLAAIGVVVAAWRTADVETELTSSKDRSWLAACVAGFAGAAAVILAGIAATGASPSIVYEGVIVEALRVRDAMIVPYVMPPAALAWGVVAAAAAAFAPRVLRSPLGEPSILAAMLRGAGGLVLWCAALRIAPAAPWMALPLCWIAVVPVDARSTPAAERFARTFLAALAVTEWLQVYPVPGGQVGLASLMLVPAGALCLADALAGLRRWSDTRGVESAAWTKRALALAALSLAALFVQRAIVSPGMWWYELSRDRDSLPFAGADRLRLSPQDIETYSGLADLVSRHGCTALIGYPNLNSLYLWTGIPAPPPFAPGGWITGLDDARQQRVADQLRSASVTCAIRSELRAKFWTSGAGNRRGVGPLASYLKTDFRVVERVGDYWFLLAKKESPES